MLVLPDGKLGLYGDFGISGPDKWKARLQGNMFLAAAWGVQGSNILLMGNSYGPEFSQDIGGLNFDAFAGIGIFLGNLRLKNGSIPNNALIAGSLYSLSLAVSKFSEGKHQGVKFGYRYFNAHEGYHAGPEFSLGICVSSPLIP